jgi:hypothetical protein
LNSTLHFSGLVKEHQAEKITIELKISIVGNELREKIQMMAQNVIPGFLRA